MTFGTITEAVAAMRREGWTVSAGWVRPSWRGAASYQVEATRGRSRHSIEAPSQAEVLAIANDVLARERAVGVAAA